MHKRIAVFAVVLALAAGSLVSAGSRSKPAPRKSGSSISDAVRGPATVQRLLESRANWIRQLTRSLRTLDGPPVTLQGNGMLTIIDEPDPTGVTGPKPPPEDGEDEAPPGEDNRDEAQRRPAQAMS